MAIHLCIGSVYAWSIFNPALIKVHGVAASAAGDWTEKQALLTYTLAIVFLGLSAAFAGRWLERVKAGTMKLRGDTGFVKPPLDRAAHLAGR